MCLTFLVLAIGIFMLPKSRALVRSSIEIGFAIINEKQEPLEPPEQVARRIPSIYAPAVLLAMEKKGTSPSILSMLQNPSVESIGRTLVVISAIDASAENEAKAFQEAISDQVIKEEIPRVQLLRELAARRIASITSASDTLEREIKANAAEIERISALSDDLRGQLEKQRANLATLYQRAGAAQPGERSTIETEIRELSEQISSQTRLLGILTLERVQFMRDLAETRRQYEPQIEALADAQLAQKMFNETRVSLAPSLLPVATSSRRLSMLLVALTISVLVAFGTVVLLHNVAGRSL
jgi:hypothetical protein